MSLVMKGITIPRRQQALHALGEYTDKLVIDGVEVWSTFNKFRTFLTSGVFSVPVGVTVVRLCGVAGGGGGSSTNNLGGSSGEIVSGVDYPVTPGTDIVVTIGAGGVGDTVGEETLFGSILTLQGGTPSDYQGEGADRVTCGGVHQDGILVNTYYGGQAGPFSDGGDGEDEAGTYGSGGGAGITGGDGGQGRLMIRWSEGD